MLKKMILLTLAVASGMLPLHSYAATAHVANPPVLAALQENEPEEYTEQLNSLLALNRSRLDTIKGVVQTIVYSLSQKIIVPPNTKNTMEWLHNVMAIISTVEQTNLSPIDESKLAWLAKNNSNLITALNQACASSFKNLPKIPFVHYHPVRTPTPLKNVIALMGDNEKAFAALDKGARNAGIRWYNHIFRKIESIAKSPVFWGAAALIGGSGLVMRLTNKPEWLMEKIYGRVKLETDSNDFSSVNAQDSSPMSKRPFRQLFSFDLFNPSSMHGYEFRPGLYKTAIDLGDGTTRAVELQDLGGAGALELVVPIGSGIVGLAAGALRYMPATGIESLDKARQDFMKKVQHTWSGLTGVQPETNRLDFQVINESNSQPLVGLDEQMKEMDNIIEYLIDPERYIRSGREISKGILLTGPSRCGKTAMAKELARRINERFAQFGVDGTVKFIELPHFNLTGKHAADWSLRAVIDNAKENAPCIIFIDELHLLQLNRTGNSQLLAEFLTVLDDLNSIKDPRKQVFIIAATNNQSQLDMALLKKNRFGKIIHFSLPTFDARKKFFEHRLQLMGINPTDFDLDLLAGRTQSCSYGDLAKSFDEALLATKNREALKQKHLDDAINKNIRLISTKSTTSLSEKSKEHLAAHIGGWALSLNLLPTSDKLDIATLAPMHPDFEEVSEFSKSHKNKDTDLMQYKRSHGNVFTLAHSEDIAETTRQEHLIRAKVHLAGKTAEDILVGDHLATYRPWVRNWAFQELTMYLLDGRAEETLTSKEKYELNTKAMQKVAECENEIRELLLANKPALQAIAQALRAKQTITRSDVEHLVQQNRAI